MKKFLINGVEVSQATYEYYREETMIQIYDNLNHNLDHDDKDLKNLKQVKFEKVVQK